MGCTPLILLLSIGLTYAIGLTKTSTPQHALIGDVKETEAGNATARRSRHIHEVIELPAPSEKTKRQVIKIPPSVSKVKLVQPPLNLRHNRAPQQFSRHPPNFRNGAPWRPASKKSQAESDYDMDYLVRYDLKKMKRNLKRPIVKEVSPEEFFRDEDYDFEPEERKPKAEKAKKQKQIHKLMKLKKKKPKQNISSEYYDDISQDFDDSGFDDSKLRYKEAQQFYGYEPAGPGIQVKQVSPPNLFPKNTPKQSYVNDNAFYDENYGAAINIKKLPTKGRQIQSLFSQQYTTHNPHVATNFGLGKVGQIKGAQFGAKGLYGDASVHEFVHPGKYTQQITASSDQVMTSFPVKPPGIQVIQPPQFRDVTVSHPSHPSRLMSSLSQQNEETSSQKATIRDILEQDCPGFDKKGYCDSPPRYPMQQIKNMVKKCTTFMEAMNTQPFEESQQTYGFSKRSDDSEERIIQFNNSMSSDLEAESTSWSRSGSDGVTACVSDVELTEPGYAKEVNSGRWFVIVQHPDTTIQRIATDLCRSPGKACGGLSEMKCSKLNNVISKSTRCVQRHTYQRLISWDPESPDECPRMRVFRFPSACVCHLGVI